MASTQDLPGRTDPAPSPRPPAAGDSAAERGDNGYGEGADAGGNDRGRLVALILIGVVVATAVMVASIWYRWSGVREPTTAIIVSGDASLAGTEVIVTGVRATATLDASNKYRVTILVEPGEYVVIAKLRDRSCSAPRCR
jgi:hypothetical protein